MIENFLRQKTTVRSRIMAGGFALFIALVLTIPVTITNQSFLFSRLQEVTEVEVRADRLLLQASARISNSRTNLSRYIQGFTSDANASLEDVSRTIETLSQASALPINAELRQEIDSVLVDLAEYEELIRDVERNRQSEAGQMVQLEVQTLQSGSDLGVRIDQIIQKNASRVDEVNASVYSEAQNRLTILLIFYFVIIVVSVIAARFIRQSITNPIASLQEAAELFRQGQWGTTVAVSGNDELTHLGETFNQMAVDLVNSQANLERRVVQRTQSLEMSAEISRSLSSILDQDAFSIAVVEQIQTSFGYYYVQLYLADDTNNSLTLKSATGLAGQKMLIRGHRLQVGSGLVGKAAATRNVVVAADVTNHPEWLQNPLLPETISEVAIPIVSRGVALGVLDIQHNIRDGINEEDITLLTALTNQIAVALQNSRLFSQIQQRANHEAVLNQLTQKIQLASSVDQVLQITAQELGKALNADYTSIQLGKQNRPGNGHAKRG